LLCKLFTCSCRPTSVREVIENRFGCQLFLASDKQFKDTIIENVRHHMDQAHAFIAEVIDANPNVMFELGAARFDLRERPIVLMRKTKDKQLPVDLQAEMLNPVTKLNISRRSNPKMTKLACKDNPSEPVYITRILTHETL
jgi:hypothetical protein